MYKLLLDSIFLVMDLHLEYQLGLVGKTKFPFDVFYLLAECPRDKTPHRASRKYVNLGPMHKQLLMVSVLH